MKVLLLGAGMMGKGGIRALEYFPDIESVTVADMNFEAAQEFADDINFPEADAIELDATDTEKLKDIVKDYDIVFNTVGPFSEFGVPILEAVIEAGTNYVDVCDDDDATIDLLELHEKAEEAGVTALINCGQTPGTSNMQAKYTAEMLDSVNSIEVAWAVGEPNMGDSIEGKSYDFTDAEDFKAQSPAGWNHLVHCATGEITIWKDGQYETIRAWEDGKYIDFAEPMGRFPVWYVGHSEPITLPRYIDIKDWAACLGGNRFHEELREEARGHKDAENPPVDDGSPVWEAPDKWKDKGVWQGQAVIVEGEKDGEKVRYTNRHMCSIYDKGIYTFAGQAIGIYLLGNMENPKPGVYAPEGLLDTEEFFNELVRITNEANGWDFTLEELVPIEKEVIE